MLLLLLLLLLRRMLLLLGIDCCLYVFIHCMCSGMLCTGYFAFSHVVICIDWVTCVECLTCIDCVDY